jgi:hypothetical protein
MSTKELIQNTFKTATKQIKQTKRSPEQDIKMANKHMETNSASFITIEIQIKTPMT